MNIAWTVILLGILVWTSLFASVISQQNGFISIACGGVAGRDKITGLDWVRDEDFLHSVKDLKDEAVAISATVRFDDEAEEFRDNAEQLKTARVFVPLQKSRSKYCYNLSVPYDKSNLQLTDYLLRAMFPSSSLDYKGQPLTAYGTRFYFIVDATFIKTIDLDPKKPQTVELVVTPLDETLYVCLVPLEDRSSMAAISSLELRPLGENMYSERSRAQSIAQLTDTGNRMQNTYLRTVGRLNFGAPQPSRSIRYPDDLYDRLWYPAVMPAGKSSEITPRRTAYDGNINLQSWIQEPPEAMLTAWEGNGLSSEISFTFNIKEAQLDRPVSTFHLNMMFLDVNPTESNGSRYLDIYLEHTGGGLNSTGLWQYEEDITSSTVRTLYDYEQQFYSDFATFKVLPAATIQGTHPAIVNAVELYAVLEASSTTAQIDASSIKDFAQSFDTQKGIDTAGDPCLPVSWGWLACSLIEMPPRITQINLTSKGVGTELHTTFGLLNRLTVLDLSNNSFYGSLPASLVDVVTLRALNLADNSLSGELPIFRRKSMTNLEFLSLRNNSLSGNLSSLVNALDETFSSLFSKEDFCDDAFKAEAGAFFIQSYHAY